MKINPSILQKSIDKLKTILYNVIRKLKGGIKDEERDKTRKTR